VRKSEDSEKRLAAGLDRPSSASGDLSALSETLSEKGADP